MLIEQRRSVPCAGHDLPNSESGPLNTQLRTQVAEHHVHLLSGRASSKSARSASKCSGAAAETAPVASWAALHANRRIVSFPVFCSLLRNLQQQRQVVLTVAVVIRVWRVLQPPAASTGCCDASQLTFRWLPSRRNGVACEQDNFAEYDRRTVHHPIFGFGVWQPSLCQAYSHS